MTKQLDKYSFLALLALGGLVLCLSIYLLIEVGGVVDCREVFLYGVRVDPCRGLIP